jgi:hypothetical protein
LGSRLGEFLEHHLYPKKEEMLSYDTQTIAVFGVKIKFE